MQNLKITIDGDLSELRLDQAIAKTGRLSRGKARKIIDFGGCYLNRKRIRKAGASIKDGDVVTMFWRDQELENLTKPQQVLSRDQIIYEDSEIVAIHKPLGLPSQATRTQNRFHVAAQCEAVIKRPAHIVHRLDRDTTGIMLLAKTKNAYKKLSELFVNRKVEKIYHCLILGSNDSQWQCKLPIGKIKPELGRVFIDKKRGLAAETHFKLIKTIGEFQLVEAKPITGRTHQIRVHLESHDTPIIGDINYGGAYQRLKMRLHAKKISFPYWKTDQVLSLEAPLPEDFIPSDLES